MKIHSILLVVLLTGCEEGAYLDTASLDDAQYEAQARQAAGLVAVPAAKIQERTFAHDLAVLTVSTDRGDDGTIDTVQETTFNEATQRSLLREDRDGDGEFEIVTAFDYVYDGNRLIRVETDDDADGTVDIVETREYTTAGRIWRTIRDEGADGKPDRIEESTWDADNRRIRSTIDAPVGGPVETIQEYAYGNDAGMNGRLMHRYNERGLVQSTRYETRYLPSGQLESMDIDLTDDGQVDNRIERVYDADGQMIGTLTDNGADGTIDTLHSYIYSDDGRLIELAIDVGNDGSFDNVIYRDYHNFKPANQGCP